MKLINTSRLPLFNIPDKPIIKDAQDFVPVADIVEDIVIFKDGGAAIVLESTSLNFGLLSEREQEAVIAAYAALINSLSFSVQILIRSQRKNIGKYLIFLDSRINEMQNPKLKGLMISYKNFISETIKRRNVLGKRFFIIIPFSAIELGFSKSMIPGVNRSGPLPFSKSYILKKAKTILTPKKDHLIRQAGRMGLKLTHVNKEGLINLFYESLNPDIETVKEKQKEII